MNEKKKVILPMSEYYCARVAGCCAHNANCYGTRKLLPTGVTVLHTCGCAGV